MVNVSILKFPVLAKLNTSWFMETLISYLTWPSCCSRLNTSWFAGGPQSCCGTHCPGPGCKGRVKCQGGDGQYPPPVGGPHGINDPPDASPHGGGHMGGCPPPGNPPYGIVVDVWALLEPCNNLEVRIYKLTIIETRWMYLRWVSLWCREIARCHGARKLGCHGILYWFH
jgi:hypothetical protein